MKVLEGKVFSLNKRVLEGIACDHGNLFLCREEEEREGYWIEVRTVFNVRHRGMLRRSRCVLIFL